MLSSYLKCQIFIFFTVWLTIYLKSYPWNESYSYLYIIESDVCKRGRKRYVLFSKLTNICIYIYTVYSNKMVYLPGMTRYCDKGHILSIRRSVLLVFKLYFKYNVLRILWYSMMHNTCYLEHIQEWLSKIQNQRVEIMNIQI